MTDATSAEAPIFVVGIARSGTTLLSAMLSRHSRLDCGPESRFFARYRHLGPAARRELLDARAWPGPAVDFIGSLRNQGHPVVDLYGLRLDDVRGYLAMRSPSVPAMLEALTALHAQWSGKARWIEKTPRHLLMTDTLRRHWPTAHLVRIVRDPRDVSLSLAGLPFAKESVVGNLVRIDRDDRASRARLAADRMAMTLRYEGTLVSEPEREMRRICRFIGEAFEPAMLEPGEAAADVAAEHEWWKAQVAGPLQTGSVGRWRREMSADAQRFAALHVASILREHGYEGAQEARSELAVVPGGDSVGPRNERLLLELARRGRVVLRPAPSSAMQMHRRDPLVFLGLRGQLDPSRGRSPVRRVMSAGLIAAGLVVRRLQGRPIVWVRRATLQPRRPGDPIEVFLVALLRIFARQATLDEVWELFPARG